MEPIWQLINSKKDNEDWNPDFRGCLKSAVAGRQYPQTRVMAAVWSEHNRCIMCLSDIVDAEDASGTDWTATARCSRTPVVATPDQINRAPTGNLNHRIWKVQVFGAPSDEEGSSKGRCYCQDVQH